MSDWQPIETVPKDGREVRLLQDGIEYDDHEWFEGAWCMVMCDQAGPYPVQRLTHPTHWMPRPQPPEDAR